jgi:hypothetical protein
MSLLVRKSARIWLLGRFWLSILPLRSISFRTLPLDHHVTEGRAMIRHLSRLFQVPSSNRSLRYARSTRLGVSAVESLEQRILLSACCVAPCAPKVDPCAPKDSCSTGKSCCENKSGCESSSKCSAPPTTPACSTHDICGQLEAILDLISGCCSSHSQSAPCGGNAG